MLVGVLPAERLLTYDDLLALPDATRAEIIAGQLYTAPGALPDHSWVSGALTEQIRGSFGRDGRGPGGWWIFAEVDVRLGTHDIVRPDLSGWRRDRLPEPWGKRPIDVVPDWVCEILSPSNAAYDRVKKANLYASSVVPFMWLISPGERVLEAFRLDGGMWVRFASYDESAMARIAPFEAIEIEVGQLFPPIPPA